MLFQFMLVNDKSKHFLESICINFVHINFVRLKDVPLIICVLKYTKKNSENLKQNLLHQVTQIYHST